jgi:hypothetical protein
VSAVQLASDYIFWLTQKNFEEKLCGGCCCVAVNFEHARFKQIQ